MRKVIEVSYEIVPREKLDPKELEELQAATEAREESYVPHSNFKVGSAIRTNDGHISMGWKVENAMSKTLHATVNAIGRIPIKSRERGLHRITIVGGPAGTEHKHPVAPCGSCRQQLINLAQGDDPMVIMAGTKGDIVRMFLKDTLPLDFLNDT